MSSSQDYSKLKNAELESLLKNRGLPTGGKKADMVARLQEADTTAEPAAANGGDEDQIDWDDDATKPPPEAATTTPAAAAIAAGGTGQAPNPEAVPNQVKGEDTTVLEGTTVVPPTEGETTAEPDVPKQDFSAHLDASSLDAELEKRKKRAARFGLAEEDTKDVDKNLERAKRFGTDAAGGEVVKGLDAALPEREKKRGRGGDQGGRADGGKRRDSRRREGKPGGQGRDGGTKSNEQREKDKQAAEARKKRFAA